jgi:hypothetical protein
MFRGICLWRFFSLTWNLKIAIARKRLVGLQSCWLTKHSWSFSLRKSLHSSWLGINEPKSPSKRNPFSINYRDALDDGASKLKTDSFSLVKITTRCWCKNIIFADGTPRQRVLENRNSFSLREFLHRSENRAWKEENRLSSRNRLKYFLIIVEYIRSI